MSRLSLMEKLPMRCVGLMAGVVTTTAVALPGKFESIVEAPSSVDSVQERSKFVYRRVRLDLSSLRRSNEDVHDVTSRSVTLPLPEGGETKFTLEDSGVLPSELAEKYPEIRSMKGRDAYGRQIRLDITPNGMRAIVFDSSGAWGVQPAPASGRLSVSDEDYVSFRDRARSGTLPERQWNGIPSLSSAQQPGYSPSADGHREYRLAIATTSAFTRHFGGTVRDGLAAVVETVNRVNAVFERDLGLHLTLAKDNDKIIFTDPASDPYIAPPDNTEFGFERSQNVRVTNEAIGAENYDVGHLFELDDAGGAISAICEDEGKADASSGVMPSSSERAGPSEQFVGTVMHELGHQFGAGHTFNGCIRDEEVTFEPGSGSTIMSYAGECFLNNGIWPPQNNSLHNLQDSRDAYFHSKSIEQVRAYVDGPASVCGVKRNVIRHPPVISPAIGSISAFVPARTPFYLEGHAQSSNRKAQLTYAWEQIDAGTAQAEAEALTDKGEGPIFRSYPPTASGMRVFPRLSVVLGDEAEGKDEVYPTTTRDLNFRLTVRDNMGDHASTSFIDRKIRTVDTGQAFSVTYPTAGAAWKGASKRLVTWNVASTEKAPINCRSVRIDLSADGGHSYLHHPLIASTPNTGRARVDLPPVDRDLTRARVRVSCNDHLFFAVSPGNFTIAR